MRKNKGISLIVLIITIIVILILATIILVSVTKTNPIKKANKAKYESDRDNMQSIFTNVVAYIMAENEGVLNISTTKLNTVTSGVDETIGEVTYTITDATNMENTSGKIIFDDGNHTNTEFYTGKKLPIYAAGETKWYVDSEGRITLEVAGVKYGSGDVEIETISAAMMQAEPTTYYGATVTNYETGDTTIDSQVDWQIFHSDGENIYLIAKDYIAPEIVPQSRGGNSVSNGNQYCIGFSSVYTDYNSIGDMIDERLQALNSKYFECLPGLSHENGHAVAYMMDISDTVWGKFAGEYAAYAIGGPTIELFLDSYNAKKGTSYKYKVDNDVGYKISCGSDWSLYSSDVLDTTDTQYVITETNKAYGMWFASPSGIYPEMHIEDTWRVCGSSSHGSVDYGDLTYSEGYGLRPVVCLNSDVVLEAVDGGFAIK